MATEVISSGALTPGLTGVGDTLIIDRGGTALDADIDGGSEVLFGVDSAARLTDSAFMVVSSGGTAASGTVAQGAVETLFYSGKATHAVLSAGGYQVLSYGATAIATIVSSGGFEAVSRGGEATATTVSAGGLATFAGSSGQGGLYDGYALGRDLAVEAGGMAVVSAYGRIDGGTVGSGGILWALSGSLVSGVAIASGGDLIAAPGATIEAESPADIVSTGVAVIEPGSGVTVEPAGAAVLSLGSGAQALILPGGLAGGTLTAGAAERVYAEGLASGTTLSGSFQVISSGGSAADTVLDAGAVQYVFSGGSASGTTVSNGFAIVDAGGTATGVLVLSGGNETLDGVVSDTLLASGGGQYVASGGTAVSTTVQSGGYAFVFGATRDPVIDGGYEVVSAGGSAVSGMVESGGTLIDATGAAISAVTIGSGGLLLVEDGARTHGATVASGGTLVMLAGGTVSELSAASGATIISGGAVVVVGGGTAVTIDAGSADGLLVGSGSSAIVLDGGIASGLAIAGQGVADITAGGTAIDTEIAAGGTLAIAGGAVISGAILFSGAGGVLQTDALSLPGAVISGFASGDTILLPSLAGSGAVATLGSGNVLSVTTASGEADLQLDPAQNFSGDVFSATLARDGGTTVTITPAAASGASVAGNATPVDVPLYVVNVGDGYYRVGIEASLDGGATYQMYLFDAGAPGLYAAYTPDTWSAYSLADTAPALISYEAGITLTSQAVETSVTLETTAGTPLTIGDTTVGLITSVDGSGTAGAQSWNAALVGTPSAGTFAGLYFGDFGVDLQALNGIDNPLSEITGGLANGFIVNIGPYSQASGGQIGTLQIGLTQADIASYGTLVPMQGEEIADPFANSGEPTYAQALGSGTLTLSDASGSFTAPVGIIYDTGDPALTIQEPEQTLADLAPYLDGTTITAGTTVTLAAATTDATADWSVSFTAGDTPGVDLADVSSGDGEVNVGLNAYFGESVMFDVADGLIGFAPIACFAAGTRLRTADGGQAVEALRPADSLVTLGGAVEPIRWIGRRKVDCRRHPAPQTVLPVRIRAHAFGPGLPERDLYLSPDHALFLEDVLIPVKHLIDGQTIAQMNRARVTYYHVELARHDVIFAEGLPAETYLEAGCRAAFANGGAAVAAQPRFAPGPSDALLYWEALGFAPLVVTGPAVQRAKQRLAQAERGERRLA